MVNRDNFLIARSHLDYLRDVYQLNPRTIERYWIYLKHLLIWADATPLCSAADIRPTFPTYLTSARLDGDIGPLAQETLRKIVLTCKRFFVWMKTTYPRQFKDLSTAWIETLRPPRSIPSGEDHQFVALEEVRHIASLSIEEGNVALRRDQAAAVLLFLSGMRAGAFCTLPIRALDLSSRTVKQWPSLGVETKNRKSATTYLLDIPDLLAVVERWDTFVRGHMPPDAMWYTPTISRFGEQILSPEPPGLRRSVAVIKRMRKLFAAAGLPYRSPHKFRHGHAVFALQHARTMADYKAVSMNLMHEDIRVTDGIYAPLAHDEVQQRIAGLTDRTRAAIPTDGDLVAFVHSLSQQQMSEALILIGQRLAT
jgi:integrase